MQRVADVICGWLRVAAVTPRVITIVEWLAVILLLVLVIERVIRIFR